MTGITKDELMQMAREAGASPLIGISSTLLFSPVDIERLFNAILERAAVECDKVEDFYWHGECAHAASSCGQAVSALKINTGD